MNTPRTFLVASIATLTAAALADTHTWDGSTGDWTDPARWSPAAVPAAGDDVIIAAPGAYTVTALGAINLNSLTFSATDATLLIEARTINGSASLITAGGLVNGGIIALDSQSTFAANSATLTVTGGVLDNAAGKSIQLLGNGTGKHRVISADVDNAGSFTIADNAAGQLGKSSGIFNNTGTVSIGTNAALTFGSSSVFNQNAGTLSIAGLFEMSADTFNFNGGTVSGGAAVLSGSTLNIGAGAGAGEFSLRGSGTLSGDVAANHILSLDAVTATGVVNVTAATGFTNNGLIRLDSSSTSISHTATLGVTAGTLTNAAGGEMRFGGGGASKARTLNASVDNFGLFSVQADASLALAKVAASFNNHGNFSIAAGGSLTFGSSNIFNQNAGTLHIGGSFDMSADTFNFNGGTITGNAPVLTGSTLNIGPGAGAGQFRLRGSGSGYSGDMTSSHVVIIEAFTGIGTANVTAASGFTNNGLITLDSASTSASHNPALTVTSGTLVNASGGEIRFDGNGAGKSRVLSADVTNNGSVVVQSNAALSLARSNAVFTNNNSFSVATGGSVTFGSLAVFNQNAGTLANSGSFEMGADTFNFNGGALTGNAPVLVNCVLNIGPAAGPGAFIFQSTGNTFTGNLAAHHTLDIQATTSFGGPLVTTASGFTNSGLIRLDSISTTPSHGATLSISSGTLVNAAGAEVRLGNGGAGLTRTVTASVDNAGLWNIQPGVTHSLNRANGIFTNTGNFDIGAGASVTFGSLSVFNQNAGTLANGGSFEMSNDTFNFNGGNLTGNTPVFIGATLNIGAGAGTGAFIFQGSSNNLSGIVAAHHTLDLQATTTFGGSILTAASGFTNNGLIRLDSISTTPSHGATLSISSGTLVNAAGAEVRLGNGGAGLTRTVTASVDNAGLWNIQPGVTHSLNRANGIFTNTGSFDIGAGASVTFGTLSVFNQNAGTLANGGSFEMSTDTFNFNGGDITGNPALLITSTLNIGPGAGAGAFIMRSGGNTLTGNIGAGQTLTAEASPVIGGVVVTAPVSFTVDGTLRLDSTATLASHTASLTVTSGSLTIGAGGILDATRTSGPSTVRSINAHLDNDGQVTIRDGAELTLTRNSGVHFNDGTLTIGSGSKLELLGTGTRTLTNRGLINGTGILDVDSASASFLNSGTIAPGNSPGILTIEGNATFDSDAALDIELAGLVVGTDYDQLVVVGDLVLSGDLFVTLLHGFIPAPGDTFTIISTSGPGNEITGTFANAPGGIVPIPGGSATVTYNPTSVVLTNVVPEPSSALLLLGGISLLARRRRA